MMVALHTEERGGRDGLMTEEGRSIEENGGVGVTSQDSGGLDDPNRCAENPEFRPGRRITGTISIFYDRNWKYDADTAKRDCSKDLGINSTSFRYVLCMSEALSQVKSKNPSFKFSLFFFISSAPALDEAHSIRNYKTQLAMHSFTSRGKDSQGEEVIKPYTPTTLDTDVGYFALVIKMYPQGRMSHHFREMREGDYMAVKGPKVARAVLENPSGKTKVHLIYANVTSDDILFKAS
ncbi:hypothetical protein L2E82_31045 [Cichorium intybus]|uniref:Uncharacterized protein n=1 Tax=Cichorium intybus TaxID=13427 RepID=A0ACB9D2Q0_CICIN|nr:hypothetical protein L2E82_31045 [Cichorium intybus]